MTKVSVSQAEIERLREEATSPDLDKRVKASKKLIELTRKLYLNGHGENGSK